MSQHEQFGPEHYRSLFEGSQASLADMAARQAQALARVGRLRSAVVAVLRKNFTELSAQAEANLGGRLSEVDDEILLAYLDSFTAAASRGDQRATIQALKEAVMSLGIALRGDEPLVWVEQIHQHRQHVQQNRRAGAAAETKRAGNRHGAPDPGARDADAWGSSATGQPEVAPGRADGTAQHEDVPTASSSTGNQPLPVDDYWKWDESTPLGDLFGDLADTPSQQPETAPRRWDNELGAIGPAEDRWTPSPIAPAKTPRTGPAPAPAVAPEPEETISTPAPRPATTTELDARADDVPTAAAAETPPNAGGQDAPGQTTGRKTAKRQPRQRATAPGASVGNTTPAARADTSGTTTADLSSLFEDASTDAVTGAVSDTAPVTPLGTTTGGTTTGGTTTGGTTTGGTATGGVTTGDLIAAPMRPELFVPSTPKRRRGTRTKTSAPITEIPLAEFSAPQELNDGMRTALLAAAAIPRPVFTRDLIGVAGSLAMVDAWEAECRADVSASPVRFVAPKSRHRLRGHLVAVEPSVVRPGDWWYQAVQRYRAGRLYELAVLLHRVGDEIVSFTLEDQLAVFHLNTPRGLVGMVVVLDPRPVLGGGSSEELANHLGKLLAERLTMIAVLTASAEPGSLENLVAHVEELAGRHAWQPTAPVIAARSWEYADDRGTSAVMVLGQS